MIELPYPVAREAERLRRWCETAGAEHRLVLAVCSGEAMRARIEEELGQGGRIDIAPLELLGAGLAHGEVVPGAFREHRGTHTSYRLFAFRGLGARVAVEGTAVLDTLERAVALFQRPATWALVWLDDPALVELVRRVAPRFHAAVQLHPTFPEPSLFAAGGPSAVRTILAERLPRARSGAADPEPSARLLLDRGSLLETSRLLREAPFEVEPLLLVAAEVELLGGDPQRALAHLAAAARYGGARRPEALARAAQVLARLGDRELARALAAEAEGAATEPPALVALASAALAIRENAEPAGTPDRGWEGSAREAVSRARAAAAKSPLLLARLASQVEAEPGGADLGIELRGEALRAAGGGAALGSLLESDLGLALARGGGTRRAEANQRLDSALAAARGPGDLAAARARRGLSRLALEASAAPATDARQRTELLERASGLIALGLDAARAGGSPLETLELLWERVSLEAAREDLDGVLRALAAVLDAARAAGLRPIAFEALLRHAEALRFARELARASGELDELEALALDLTWPDLEARALVARGDHLREIAIPGEARTSYAAALTIARAARLDAIAAALERKLA